MSSAIRSQGWLMGAWLLAAACGTRSMEADDATEVPNCTPRAGFESSCTNRIDDDCNGQIDCVDSYCRSDPVCAACTAYETSCNDGVDNDCDLVTDCLDSDCVGNAACRPCDTVETSCIDGIDNDCNNYTDCN